ncbi:MAG: hypothetical protein LBH60_04100 [Prevotellaceae bacterium]|jgi:hypothetical protein|nr:hypothetical protein [Prevotellaceae bacterium]
MNGLFETKTALLEFACVCISEYEKRKSSRKKGKSSDLITQREAYREFGEGWIKAKVSNCLLHGKKHGKAKNSPVYFSRTEIAAIKAAEKMSELGMRI